MKNKLFTLICCFAVLLSVSGCAGISLKINLQEPGDTASTTSDESYLKQLTDANSFDAVIARNGRLSYTIKSYLKDGSEDEYTIYADADTYVRDDVYALMIITDNESYGYDREINCPFRTMFVGSFDDYVERNEYRTIYTYEDNEHIDSMQERDGLLYIESSQSDKLNEEFFAAFGYSPDDIDSINVQYTVDPSTLDILSCKSYIIKENEKKLYSEQLLDRECEEYVPDEQIISGVFGDNIRTATVYADAGTDHEKVYTQTITKGGAIRIFTGHEFYTQLYADKDCVTFFRKVDRSKDITLYLKRRVDYSDKDNWAYYGIGEDKDADLFLIGPTVDMKDEYNMSMDDDKTKAHFLGALNMERGIYEENTRMFAPYYRHAAMKVYSMTPAEREDYLVYAYDDVAEAFEHYIMYENHGRPIILAGFSQGADMCYRLLEDYFDNEYLKEHLVAVYAIGWPCTKEMTEQFPQIIPAQGEDDTGVVVSFDCEAPDVKDTFITPAKTKAYTINPLNWKTDETPADKTLNIGACFTDYDGNILKEESGLCGCYIDISRGIVKIPDLDPADYPAVVPNLPEGAYHIYDYQFFYRNLEENVGKRIDSFRNGAE